MEALRDVTLSIKRIYLRTAWLQRGRENNAIKNHCRYLQAGSRKDCHRRRGSIRKRWFKRTYYFYARFSLFFPQTTIKQLASFIEASIRLGTKNGSKN